MDCHDLAGVVIQKKRFLQNYSELVTVMDVSKNELKNALPFEGVRIPPVAKDSTTYAFEEQMGIFNPFSGLDTPTVE